MSSYIDMDLFLAQLRAKRGDLGLRETANQIGEISASTLSRIENGKIPDMEVFLRICDWMGVSPDSFISSDERMANPDTPEIIEAHLRADKHLDADTADAIAQMVRKAYELNRRRDNAEE